MALKFVNATRSYDAARKSVSFWGHDAWTEVTFDVGEEALHHIDPRPHLDEATTLQAFDANRPQIERAAGKAYAKRRQTWVKLGASDF